MRLRVRLFGVMAERAGGSEEMLELPEGATGAELLRAIGERHPETAAILDRISLAVNLEVASPERPLSAGDEVALLPPVAGGAEPGEVGAEILVGLRERPSVEEAMAAVASPVAGGTAVFVGTVRDRSDTGPVERLEYSAYEEMAERVLEQIAEEAAAKWSLVGVAILHGVGSMPVGHPTMAVACAARHRGDAFEACRYAVDEVKRRVPVWKKERGPWGERWVNLE
jgi:MoaE-MoaD fusion protein